MVQVLSQGRYPPAPGDAVPGSHWMIASDSENFDRSARQGLTVVGLRSRHRKKAERMLPGDRVLFFVRGEDAFAATAKREDRTRSNVYATAETVLAAFADPGVLASAMTSDLRAEHLLDGGHHTAYICAPAHEQRRLQPLFATLVQEVTARAYEQATEWRRDQRQAGK